MIFLDFIDRVPDSVVLVIVMAVVIAVCWFENRRLRPASPGPDAEKASRARRGASPTEAPVVSGGTLLADRWLDSLQREGIRVTPEMAARAAWLRATEPQRLEQAPACDRHNVLSTKSLSTQGVSTTGLSSVVVRSTAEAGASAFIYRWVRPAEGKRLAEFGWNLEHVDPRYQTWLVRKVERWP